MYNRNMMYGNRFITFKLIKFTNLYKDKRVVRGNTYAALVMQSRNTDPFLI